MSLSQIPLWLWHKATPWSLTALPGHQTYCLILPSLFSHLQQSLNPSSHPVLLDLSDLPYLIFSPITALIHFQANCLHRCVQTNHLWEMPRNVNFIWNWVIAKSMSIFFLLWRMSKYCIKSVIFNYNHSCRPGIPELWVIFHGPFFWTVFFLNLSPPIPFLTSL